MQRTQRERFSIALKRNETLTTYLNFCIKYQEVPRKELVLLINNCENVKALKEVDEIISSK